VEEAKNLRFGGGGVPAPEKMRPLAGVRGMAGAAPDRRRRSLGQGGAARYAGARWPPAEAELGAGRCGEVCGSALAAGGVDGGLAGGGAAGDGEEGLSTEP
jgi:hypothetical protein